MSTMAKASLYIENSMFYFVMGTDQIKTFLMEVITAIKMQFGKLNDIEGKNYIYVIIRNYGRGSELQLSSIMLAKKLTIELLNYINIYICILASS